ncbi:uncharacterized protein FPOAC1_013802 [Fusarium poae]|uniref:uncharacterized protein n=1 Tax=Fusarium poae TaxID=36050 RepID=UPI001D04C8BF|nr:uncharacterized protein FPOAC1_013802 [Fusarium poae]KAG8664464.1 hypothetical protein FPOAC1_013802 [Fusarium poae]
MPDFLTNPGFGAKTINTTRQSKALDPLAECIGRLNIRRPHTTELAASQNLDLFPEGNKGRLSINLIHGRISDWFSIGAN